MALRITRYLHILRRRRSHMTSEGEALCSTSRRPFVQIVVDIREVICQTAVDWVINGDSPIDAWRRS